MKCDKILIRCKVKSTVKDIKISSYLILWFEYYPGQTPVYGVVGVLLLTVYNIIIIIFDTKHR